MTVELVVDGRSIVVDDEHTNLMTVLRTQCGKTSVKDGCAPQGQCGCCTVLVDGQARVSCVTPVRRVAGRSITTAEGLPESVRDEWANALVATGGSQCGFCTPGIICRLHVAQQDGIGADDPKFGNALAAHLCRCTGWQTIAEAYVRLGDSRVVDPVAAARRAELEGGQPQDVGPHVALGSGGFSADVVPDGALHAVPDVNGEWVVGETLESARTAAGKIQGRRTTAKVTPPLEVPAGEWDRTLQTSWVEPAHLETETVWCLPGGEPSSLLGNGGAFGAKESLDLADAARRLADAHDRAVVVVLSREDSVRLGPKRPPIAAGVNADGSGVLHVVRTDGIADRINATSSFDVVEVDVAGPSTSSSIRGAGWVEAAVLQGALTDSNAITAPDGGSADSHIDADGIHVRVDAGAPLDPVVLRSYCIGAAHMAYSWVTSEGLVVDDQGTIHDLTIRSFGIVRASDMPAVHVDIGDSNDPPINGSDAVFASVALAVWRSRGFPSMWPTG